MSYDITLARDGQAVTVPTHADGGTYVLGGTDRAELNVTYNYSAPYAQVQVERDGATVPFSVWMPDGMLARDTVPWLQAVVGQLGTERQKEDYWVPVPASLLGLAGQTEGLPEGIRAEALPDGGTQYYERTGPYWAPTPGNAGYAASILLGWARLHPDATWEVC